MSNGYIYHARHRIISLTLPPAERTRKMSTQDAESISFLYDRDLQGLRLLELPPELLDLLSSQDPPRCVCRDIYARLR